MFTLIESEFDFSLEENNLLIIVDLGGEKSVTNDMENVLVKISVAAGLTLEELAAKKIIYRDSMLFWDGVRPILLQETLAGMESTTIAGVEFFSLGGTTDKETAMYKRLALP